MISDVFGSDGDGDGPSMETVLETLSKPRRRAVLEQVCDRDGPIRAADLATAVALVETAGESEAVPIDERDRIRRSLRHVDLPKLAAAGLVEYDRRARTVVATEDGRRVLSDIERFPS